MTKEMTQGEKEAVIRQTLIQNGMLEKIDKLGKDELRNAYLELWVKCAVLDAELELLRPTRIIMPH